MIKQLTIEELRAMPLKKLRLLDIDSPAYEKLVNQVVNEKVEEAPLEMSINRKDIPDIKSPEEEAKWQKVIDEREAMLRPSVLEVDSEDEVTIIDDDTVVIAPPLPTDEATPMTEPTTPNKPFCDTCDSKGVRHKKDCPKNTPAK